MKHSGTTKIFVIVWASVLFASYVTGICIREVRFHRARVESKTDTKPQVSSEVQVPSKTDQLVQELEELAPRRPMSGPRGPGGAEGPRDRPGGFGGDRMAGMRERFANMSEEERREAIAQMRERSGGRRGGGMRGRFENMSEEERARMEEERSQMRERFENMSEEEREEFRAQMRERFGGRRPQGDGQGGEGGRRRPGGRQQENN
jgi:hypothetical protein